MSARLEQCITEIQSYSNQEKAAFFPKFFKTGKGEYAEGDIFIGLTVPQQRLIARTYRDLDLKDVTKLLQSSIHEHRLIGLFLLVHHYSKSDATRKQEIFSLYMTHIQRVNNWDLVDSSAPQIVGDYIYHHIGKKKILTDFARSDSLRERRIAMLATFFFIKKDDFTLAIEIATTLLHDTHDLIHKAVGWMLREIGKRDVEVLRTFLQAHSSTMPRTMLRYAIEKMDEGERKKWMGK